jgi:hypothetical protein
MLADLPVCCASIFGDDRVIAVNFWAVEAADDTAIQGPIPSSWPRPQCLRLHQTLDPMQAAGDPSDNAELPIESFAKQPGSYIWASPTRSAIIAPLEPRGLEPPSVVSRAVWCSVCALNSPPRRTITAEIHNMKPTPAPREP